MCLKRFTSISFFVFRKYDNYRFQYTFIVLFSSFTYEQTKRRFDCCPKFEWIEEKNQLKSTERNQYNYLWNCNYTDFDSFGARSFQHFDHYFVILPLLMRQSCPTQKFLKCPYFSDLFLIERRLRFDLRSWLSSVLKTIALK